MIFTETRTISTKQRCHWIDITSLVRDSITRSTVSNGIVTVTSLHTTASITINENGDPDVEKDFFRKLEHLVPHRESYYLHSEGNSDSHVKTSLVGTDITRSLSSGKLLLGLWQSIYFCEFDGPRSVRQFTITIVGE